jgi:hypothetical protein
MRRHSSPFASSSRFAAALGACVVSLCATAAVAAEPAPAPAPAAAATTQVTAPAGSPSVVVVNTTVPAPAPVVAPAPAPAPAAQPAPAPAWIVPVQPAAASPAPAMPSRIAIDLHPHPLPAPSPEQLELSRRNAELSRAQSLRIGGWVTLGTTYLFSALVGTVAIDTGSQRIQRYGYWMTLPVAGPFGAAFQTRSATGALLTTSLGVAQAVGLGMAIVGGSRHRRLKRQLTLTAMPTRGGGHVGLSMRF